MPVIGSDSEILKQYLGSNEIGNVYLGSTQVNKGKPSTIVLDNLVAYYDFSNASSYTSGSALINDLTANGNDLRWVDSTGVSTPLYKSKAKFDYIENVNSYAVVTSSVGLSEFNGSPFEYEFSIGFWGGWTLTGSATDPVQPFMFGSENGGVQINLSGSNDLRVGDFNSNKLFYTGSIGVDEFHHIMVTYSGSGGTFDSKLYIDSQLVDEDTSEFSVVQQGGTCPISIGIPNGFNLEVKGHGSDSGLAVAYVYDRQLSDSEVLTNYEFDAEKFINYTVGI